MINERSSCVQNDIENTQNETVKQNTIQPSKIFHLFKMNLVTCKDHFDWLTFLGTEFIQ